MLAIHHTVPTLAPLGNRTFFATCPVGGNGWSTKLPMKQIVPSCANFGLYSTIWIWYKRNTHKILMDFSRKTCRVRMFSALIKKLKDIQGKGLLMWPGSKNCSPWNAGASFMVTLPELLCIWVFSTCAAEKTERKNQYRSAYFTVGPT